MICFLTHLWSKLGVVWGQWSVCSDTVDMQAFCWSLCGKKVWPEPHIYTVYIWCSWQGHHQIYGVYTLFWPTLLVVSSPGLPVGVVTPSALFLKKGWAGFSACSICWQMEAVGRVCISGAFVGGWEYQENDVEKENKTTQAVKTTPHII